MTNKKDIKDKKIETKTSKVPETTGHSWDGVSEYNIPAPRWWLIIWLVCIVWGVGYWFFYPTWPTTSGNTKGSLNWTGVSQLKESQQEIVTRKNIYLKEFSQSSFEEIYKNKELTRFAKRGGSFAFRENCSACHGTGAQGTKGYPNLNDDDWLWGGTIEDIYTTIKYGIRSGHEKARFNEMPAFGLDKILNKEEILDVAQYVMSLSDKASTNVNGKKIFKENCSACHGPSGKGDRSQGAPNLADAIWLYGDKKEDIIYSINYARAGVMPYWTGRLDDATIRQLAIYVHSLGGGE